MYASRNERPAKSSIGSPSASGPTAFLAKAIRGWWKRYAL
jgi:hypothetical protein